MHTWANARAVAASAVRALPPERRPLTEAIGQALAGPLDALTDVPAFDGSAMDGWAVRGPGPWGLRGDRVLAGHPGGRLRHGEAVAIATGAAVPEGTTSVLRSEDGSVLRSEDGEVVRGSGEHGPNERGAGQPRGVLTAHTAHTTHTALTPLGRDIRPRGQECRSGDMLLPSGTLVTPAVAALAASCGHDTLAVMARPTVDLLILGDELLDRGVPGGGRVRDALSPLLVPWLGALGVHVAGHRRVADDLVELRAALTRATADVVITTGGSARGPVDHVRRALDDLGARLLIDSVAVRPGHPMLLAELPDGRPVVGLPGNPLAATAATATLAVPLLRTLAGLPPAAAVRLPVAERVPGRAPSTALRPVTVAAGAVRPLDFHGPAMLRGLAACDAMAVIPPEGAEAGREVELLPRPGSVPLADSTPLAVSTANSAPAAPARAVAA